MKKRIALIAVLLTAFGGLFMLGQPANAVSTFNTKDNGDIIVSKDAVHNGSYYTAGNNVVINGTINGDLFCAGQTVKINGTVNGDVLCAAQKITVNGTVSQDVRSAGQTVTINGQIGGSVTAFAQDVEVTKDATIKGDLNGAAQTFAVDGTIGRDVAVAGQSLTIDGLVKGGVNANVETLSLSSKPAVMGGLDYTSPASQDIASGSVLGAVNFTQASTESQKSNNDAGAALVVYLLIALSFIVAATVLSLVMPRYFERSYAIARKKIGQVVLVGVAVNLGVPVLAVALILTGVGIPLAILLLVALLLVQMLAFSFAAYYLSRAVFGKVVYNVVPLMIVGAAILAILILAPLLNLFVILAMMVIGVGGVVTTVSNGYQKPSYKTDEHTPASRKK